MSTVNNWSQKFDIKTTHRCRTRTAQTYSPGGANVPPCNICFLCPTRVHNRNGVSIGQTVFAAAPASIFAADVYCGHGRPSQLLLSCCTIFEVLRKASPDTSVVLLLLKTGSHMNALDCTAKGHAPANFRRPTNWLRQRNPL